MRTQCRQQAGAVAPRHLLPQQAARGGHGPGKLTPCGPFANGARRASGPPFPPVAGVTARNRADVLRAMKDLLAQRGFKPAELSAVRSGKPTGGRTHVAPQYRDPVTGRLLGIAEAGFTWTRENVMLLRADSGKCRRPSNGLPARPEAPQRAECPGPRSLSQARSCSVCAGPME